MLSLPLITPRDDLTVWLQPSRGAHSHLDSHDGPDHHPQQHSRRAANRSHTALAQLVADENAIEQRKQNVRRFGAGWIRPPGISKTYQATMDEHAEREEQMMLERRDQQMQDLANAQEMEARRQQQMEAGEAADAGGAEGERDLDDEVPEAEEVTFNEESLLEGSMVANQENVEEVEQGELDVEAEVDVERMLDLEEAEISGMMGMEGDLDDDVPEAGSYQHTDTELEDDSSEADEMQEASEAQLRGGNARQSMLSEASEPMLSSSFLGSSPAARQGQLARGNAFRERLMQGRQQ